ncbi:MAG: S41 family peptidase, partial [Terriglobales bacterium]
NLPLVVLVNRGTGGPAEIVASAVLENARGDVVGDKTFGIGSIQKVIPIPDGSALILSVAKYYTPNGKAIQDDAVTPNIAVADNNDDFVLPDDEDNSNSNAEPEKKTKTMENDQQLQRAIQVLQNKEKKAA